MPSFEGLTPAKEAELKENLWKIAKFEKAIKKVATQYQYASVLKGCIYHTAPQRKCNNCHCLMIRRVQCVAAQCHDCTADCLLLAVF